MFTKSFRVRLGLLSCRLIFGHLRFWVNPERIGDAVDVVEIGDDLDGVEEIAVAEAGLAQAVAIFTLHPRWRARQLLRELAQRPFPLGQARLMVVAFDGFDQLVVVALGTEILPVSLDSVETVIDLRNHRGQQLALGTR